jgi:hypothetical protein
MPVASFSVFFRKSLAVSTSMSSNGACPIRPAAEDLEQVELDVAQVALVVAHRCVSRVFKAPPAAEAGRVTRQ